MYKRIKSLVIWFLNKLLLRRTVQVTAIEVQGLHQKIDVLFERLRLDELARMQREKLLQEQIADQNEAIADRLAQTVLDLHHGLEYLLKEATLNIRDHIDTHQSALDAAVSGLGRQLDQRLQVKQQALAHVVEESRELILRRMRVLTTSLTNIDTHQLALDAAVNGLGPQLDRCLKEGQQSLAHVVEESRELILRRMRVLTTSLTNIDTHQLALDVAVNGLGPQLNQRLQEEQQSLARVIEESRELILRRMRALTTSMTNMDRITFQQQEALSALMRIMPMRYSLPATRGWVASPDLLLFLYEQVRLRKPQQVVELGGGVSTLVIAAALRENGQGRLYSFDHEEEYAAKTRSFLAREDLGPFASVEHVPLRPWVPKVANDLAESWKWYDLPANILEMKGIDLLVVDGPPEKSGPFARYPALPTLIDGLSPDAMIVMDDTIREAETKIAEHWRDSFGLDLVFRTEFEKGMGVMTLQGKHHENK